MYPGDPAYNNHDQGFVFGNFGAPGKSVFSNDLISTGLSIILGLFAFSVLMQVATVSFVL